MIKSKLDFSYKYDQDFAERYHQSREESLERRVASQLEIRMARRGLQLAGHPKSVLDLPCGTGRFWPMLAEDPERLLLAGDSSQAMIHTAIQHHPDLAPRFQLYHLDALAIDLPDRSVESVFCMRLLHHVFDVETRLQIYREFARVSRHTACISLRVTGNFHAWRRQYRLRHRNQPGRNRTVLDPRQAETEFSMAGWKVIGKVDLLPYHSMWRTYVLALKEAPQI